MADPSLLKHFKGHKGKITGLGLLKLKIKIFISNKK